MTQDTLPWSGVTPLSREASQSGARCAGPVRGQQAANYLDWLRDVGPITDQDMATILRLPLSSINSIRNLRSVKELVEPAGSEIAICHGREKKRTKWRLKSGE